MANAQDDVPMSYRQQHVDDTLTDHEERITKNERRWLVTKGALAMLAVTKGVDFGIDQFIGLL